MIICPDLASEKFATLIELLRFRAFSQPDEIAYTFLLEGEKDTVNLTYAQLDKQAQTIAAYLQFKEQVLLLYPPGLEYIAAFFGCLYAGAIAVPAYPPRPNRSLQRLQSIVADAEASIVLTNTAVLSNLERQLAELPDLRALNWLTTDSTDNNLANKWQQPEIDSDSLAFLQYTSGSTGTPKGVMVSHGNLLHNQKMIQAGFQNTEKTIIVGWLPLYHDMGLIGNVLQPLYLGVRCILMSPVAFLQRPIRWLEAISRYQGTTSGGPNFAFDLCMRKVTPQQLSALDLSSWNVAFNGAEPVRVETIEKFSSTFASCGFRKEAFYPCYGMAETTLFVSGGIKTDAPVYITVREDELAQNRIVLAQGTEGTRTLVGCGQTYINQEIAIANPETLIRCAADEVGEIWVAGSSITQGYWNRLELTEQVFRANLADSKKQFFRTGDLGFLHNGELFITGRLKDLIIIHGRNHYPQDIEMTVADSHEALILGAGAAFTIDSKGEERLAIVQEIDRHYRNLDNDAVTEVIRTAIAQQHELQVHAIALIKMGSICKTSSGKIQRHACRNAFINGTLELWGKNK
ncbi:fatty acyl-AMP ligase [Nostoc punctiforme]|uniref:AMP-dependent synthetase and ligase n=1 Tax=Nostoc punctiforme (strain ATCC 29133 / PCC 73102) TaxID=63737 RepID=B2J647_NOSP7|nr:fatty acyl-AMP ligase [Nostoc punctiforme]ACC80747.1 AMP-dependent synthetase and ligase [Nostoc punctiforme PCC 73102]